MSRQHSLLADSVVDSIFDPRQLGYGFQLWICWRPFGWTITLELKFQATFAMVGAIAGCVMYRIVLCDI